MRRRTASYLAIGAALAALFAAEVAFGQTNNSSTWQTPGNETVGGMVQMAPNSAGVAVPVPPSIPLGTGLTASATGTTAGATATLAAAAGKTTYLCGLSVAPGSATTAITINITTTGLSANYTWSVGAPATAVGVTGAIVTVPFNPCVPASAVNTAITVSAGALGTAGVNQDVNAWGFQF